MRNNKASKQYISFSYYTAFLVISHILVFILICSMTSCSDFVEVDPPKNTLVSETVFEDAATVESALANIYYNMREQGIVSYDIGADMGIYADELDYYASNANDLSLYLHSVTAINSNVLSYWTNAYSLIYAANDIIEGVTKSKALNADEISLYKGQALFIRAYLHFILTNIYGAIPFITSTDYVTNNTISRTPIQDVYEFIIEDLNLAVILLDSKVLTDERVIPNQATVNALLSRVYLYTENWEMAEVTSSLLVDEFELESDLSKVFLKESKETIWQFKPDASNVRNTYEANSFIIQVVPGNLYALSNTLLHSFETDDLRFEQWVGRYTSEDGLTTLYFPYKYKALLNEVESLEYSIIFRLAEQYLIRAEARAQLGNISGSQSDLNTIRNRAGLENTTADSKEAVLDAIAQERSIELFSEQGHRWFDLKRTGEAGSVLELVKPNWKATDVLWPIPESEIEINPNLRPQNSGY
ncbi:RagB/SusD family nutrient uptake outer membrane protein [Formosa algae]|uniref:RagB/SusD family nutrient uptake outer membrane protein n=1 Tax=Formosa algae TaxID=225843 RepID=UPI000CD2584A|nr:RagB/SusD family nutrient uptake outer membrane protein [Formosa algae]